jgi:hypothetical protein
MQEHNTEIPFTACTEYSQRKEFYGSGQARHLAYYALLLVEE